MAPVFPIPALTLVILFITYELYENLVVHDKDYPSIAAFTVGFGLALYIHIILKIIVVVG